MKFFLGAHQPNWLALSPVSLFISDVRLRARKTFPRALTSWALDSGGFSELSAHGAWTVKPKDYVERVRRYRDEIGLLEWCAPQDWMCEPTMLEKTGLSVEVHQARTIDSYLELKSLAPELPFIPVLQGWGINSYWSHADEYARRGIDLQALPLVGVGSICRRQSTISASAILHTLKECYGLKLHGFGFKVEGLKSSHHKLETADSMAWSFQARMQKASKQDVSADPNSIEFALEWRRALLVQLNGPTAEDGLPANQVPLAASILRTVTSPEQLQPKPEERPTGQLKLF